MLLSHEDVSPNALRKNENIEEFFLRFNCHDGIGGNMNNDIKRYHGWRGTTSDVSTTAYGLREIIKIRKLKNGTVAVTVGHDLTVNEAINMGYGNRWLNPNEEAYYENDRL